MLQFDMIETRAAFTEYVERLSARPASRRAQERNAAVVSQHNLGG
jgi:hypothetical protein